MRLIVPVEVSVAAIEALPLNIISIDLTISMQGLISQTISSTEIKRDEKCTALVSFYATATFHCHDYLHADDLNAIIIFNFSGFSQYGQSNFCAYAKKSIKPSEHGLSKYVKVKSLESNEKIGALEATIYYNPADGPIENKSTVSVMKLLKKNRKGKNGPSFNYKSKPFFDKFLESIDKKYLQERGQFRQVAWNCSDGDRKPGGSIGIRQTIMDVGYVGVKWPANDSEREREKIVYKLFLAEQRRLDCMHELAIRKRQYDLERCRNF